MAQQLAVLVISDAIIEGTVIDESDCVSFVIDRRLSKSELKQTDREGMIILDSIRNGFFVTFKSVRQSEAQTIFEFERGSSLESILHMPSIKPKIRDFHFCYPVSPDLLDVFVQQNVLNRKIDGVALLCPECEGLPMIFPGCPSCGSFQFTRDELVHHFSCGHVAFLDTFIQPDGTMRCQKCQKTKMIINSDYDVSSGICRCSQCTWTGSDIRLVGTCLSCSTSFLIIEAHRREVWTYYAK